VCPNSCYISATFRRRAGTGGTGGIFYSFAMHARIEKDMKIGVLAARRARLLEKTCPHLS
jgi:hypothetical protein